MPMLLRKELKSWLPFDHSPTFDVIGNTWTAYGNPTIASTNAFHGNALQLDGNSYIKTSVELGGQDFGIDCWVYVDPATPAYGRVFNVVNPDTNNSLVIVRRNSQSPNYLDFWINSNKDETVDNGETIRVFQNAVGSLVHVVFAYSYSQKKAWLYVGNGNNYTVSLPTYTRRTFDIIVGASGTKGFVGAIDELRIYDSIYFTGMPDATTYDGIKMYCDVSRRVSVPAQEWKYENPGTADLLTLPGTTVSVTADKSITHTAFYQTARAKCFDLPQTSEIWMKFDVYFDGVNRWRAYNGGTNGMIGITGQTSGAASLFSNDSNVGQLPVPAARINQLQTILLHMISGSSAGVVEAWSAVNGQKERLGTYTGNVNQGQAFADIYLQSDGAGTLFSNVTISNAEILLDETNELQANLSLDIERRTQRTITVSVDAERSISFATQTVNLLLDAERNNIISTFLMADVARTVIWTPKELFLKSWLRFDTSPTKDLFGNTHLGYDDTAPAVVAINEIDGHALVLDGYTDIEGHILGFAGRSFSIDFWVQIDSSVCTDCDVLFSAYYIELSWKSPNELIFKTDPTGYGHGSSVWNETNGIEFSADVWNHVAIEYTFHDFTLTGCCAELYVNGRKVATHTCPPYRRSPSLGVIIGGANLSVSRQHRFVGMFAEIRFYDGDTLWKSNFTSPTAADYNALPTDKLFYYENPGMSHRFVDAWPDNGIDTQPGISSSISTFGVATEFSSIATDIMSNPTRDFWISFDLFCTREESAYLCGVAYRPVDGYDAWWYSGIYLGWANWRFKVYIVDYQDNNNGNLREAVALPYTKVYTGMDAQINQRHKFCLHMLSGSNGLIECWIDGSHYLYSGSVHDGMLFSDFSAWYAGEFYEQKLQSNDRDQPLVSNIIVSNHPLSDAGNVTAYDSFRNVCVAEQFNPDVIRHITNNNRAAVDIAVERILNITETLHIDTERKSATVVETEPFDTERLICTVQNPVIDAERALLNTVEFDVDTWRTIPHRLIINRSTREAGQRFVL